MKVNIQPNSNSLEKDLAQFTTGFAVNLITPHHLANFVSSYFKSSFGFLKGTKKAVAFQLLLGSEAKL